MNTLYWFTDDLRIADNPALIAAASDTNLTCVYCMDDAYFRTDRFGNQPIGKHRWRFLCESLRHLDDELLALGQTVNILRGDPNAAVATLLKAGRFDRVIRAKQHTYRGPDPWDRLQTDFPDIRFDEFDVSTLFSCKDLNFEHAFPNTFSQFKKAVGTLTYRNFLPSPDRLPTSLIELENNQLEISGPPGKRTGGATAADLHITAYFGSKAASTYKDTRNNLSGKDSSTGFSPWLANGSLSPLQALKQLRHYEATYGANNSTGWILFELLWREFFRWYAEYHGDKLYAFEGVIDQRPLTAFYGERFTKWRTGQTPWRIVNACMNELNATGYLSNRGRQIAASCLVNELALDWRCGAQYFEEMLVDYDPCSNFGNWQYIAGVGADPQGGRHFNLEKQAEIWDNDHAYRDQWAKSTPPESIDSLDYYDWPIEAEKNGSS